MHRRHRNGKIRYLERNRCAVLIWGNNGYMSDAMQMYSTWNIANYILLITLLFLRAMLTLTKIYMQGMLSLSSYVFWPVTLFYQYGRSSVKKGWLFLQLRGNWSSPVTYNVLNPYYVDTCRLPIYAFSQFKFNDPLNDITLHNFIWCAKLSSILNSDNSLFFSVFHHLLYVYHIHHLYRCLTPK